MSDYILQANNITKYFGGFKALDDVSIKIKEGCVFGLLGPNGAGKTTLIRIINQIFMPDKGEVLLEGKPVTFDDVRLFGYLPEERGLYRKMKVGEQAVYLAQLKGLDYYSAVKEIRHWFNKFGISKWWNKKVEELSKGMQQKIQFIITVLHKPKILIFDEPFSGFDPINANLLKNEILNLKKEGATIIFSTHNMESVEEICEDIALINKSHKILEGSILDIKNKFKDDVFYVKYLGVLQQENFDSDFWDLLHYKNEDGNTEIKVKLTDKSLSHNRLLSLLMQRGELVAFNEVLPTMNEIFIKVVEQKNSEKDE